MVIGKSTILDDVFDTVMDRLRDQVMSVTTNSSDVFTVQTYTSSFPDKEIDNKTAYPILILEPADIKWGNHTFTKKKVIGSFTIDIYSTNLEASNLFLDKIIDSIETYRTTFNDLGLFFVQLSDTNYDNVQRGGFKIHRRGCTFDFRYDFTKTRP